jgi:integrase
MARTRLTARFVETVKAEIRTDYWDDVVRGLVLRVAPSGVKSWTAVYTREDDGQKQRVTIGRFPAIDLERARSKALKLMSAVAEGEDPSGAKRKRREALTVAELGELYIEKHAKRQKKTWAEDARMLKVDIYPLIGGRKAVSVTKRDILDVVDVKTDAGKEAQGRGVFALLRKLFNWALENDYLAASPLTGLKAPGKPGKRDRVLSLADLAAIWKALPDAQLSPEMKDIFRLLMLTGQRSGEVAGMRFGEVDLAAGIWTLPADRTKNARAHIVQLCGVALEIATSALARLEEPSADAPVFSKTGQAFESNAVSQAARKKLQVVAGQWAPHDIRRSVATGMAGLGVAPHVVEAVLNHASGFKASVAGIYNRHSYDQEKRAALTLWEQELGSVVNGNDAVVVPLRKPAMAEK